MNNRIDEIDKTTNESISTKSDEPHSPLPRWLQLFMASTFGEFILYDVFISTVVGAAVWFADRSEVGLVVFFLSMLVFLIVKLYSEMVRMHQELDRSLHQEDEAIKRVDTDILRIIDVNHALLRDGDFFKYGTEMLKSYSLLLNNKDGWFVDRARVVLKECSQELFRLKSGEIYHGRYSNFYGILQQQLAATKASAFFTSDVKADFAWLDSVGEPYRTLNIQCAKAGVKITRVFIVDDLADITAKVRDLIKEQVDAGISVRIAISAKLGRDSLYDMGIYDERYVSYFDLTPNTHEIRAHHTYNTSEALEQALEIRERLFQHSDDVGAVLDLK